MHRFLALLLVVWAAGARADCFVDLQVASAPKPPTVSVKGTVSEGLLKTIGISSNLIQGTVTGALRVTFPDVNGSCNFTGVPVDPKDSALGASLALARISTPTPLAITALAGMYKGLLGAGELDWRVDGLQVSMASPEIGGKINQKKPIAYVQATIESGVAAAHYKFGASEDRINATLSGRASDATGCKLALLKAPASSFLLDCRAMRAPVPPFSQGGVKITLTLGVKGLTATGLLSDAAPAPPAR